MSSTLAPATLSPNNPITSADVTETLATLDIAVPAAHVGDYQSLLTGIWEVWHKVDQMDDYVPAVDETRFPRTHVHRPAADENEFNAWAWKATVKGAEGGVLAGKTVCLKDNVALKGVPCLMGSDVIADWVPNTDATVVTRILEAGATITGKAVCENLSLWGVSCSASTGPMSNAYAPGYSAGGSSSGTGVLVARGVADLGVGGDQGGSIRLPAAHNGIVGLKPTTGLVPYTGIASLEAVLDHAGPMTRTVLDNAAFLAVLAGADGIDDRQQAGCPFPGAVPDYASLAQLGIAGLKVGILAEGFDQPLHDARVSALVRKAAESLRALGAQVDEVSVPMHKAAPDIWAVVGRLSATTALTGKACGRRQLCLNDLTDKMGALARHQTDKMWCSGINTLVNGAWGWEHMPPTLMGKATNLIRKLRDAYHAQLDTYDVLITPTVPMLAQPLPRAGASPAELMVNSAGLSLNTSAFNITGLPALSLPIGFLGSTHDDSVRLPVGMQIVSRFYGEDKIYRVAYAWEQAYDWKTFA
ncbi:hypothetical protein Q5752_005185 [Cryptotrichosporon argae]